MTDNLMEERAWGYDCGMQPSLTPPIFAIRVLFVEERLIFSSSRVFFNKEFGYKMYAHLQSQKTK